MSVYSNRYYAVTYNFHSFQKIFSCSMYSIVLWKLYEAFFSWRLGDYIEFFSFLLSVLFRVASNVSINSSKILQLTILWYKTFSNSSFIIVVIRPVVYKFWWTLTKCRAKHCTNQTMVVRNASLDSRWIKRRCLFISIEVINTWGVWAFETCWVFNDMVQFKPITQILWVVL